MKALMIHAEATGVGYYRIWMQAKYLRRIGWEVVELDRDKKDIALEELEPLLDGIDILIVQRHDDLKAVAAYMAAGDIANCPVVVDMDDDIFDVSENSPAYKAFHPGSESIVTVCQQLEYADAITVSTPALADVYKKYNNDITILRNCQDPEDWVVPSYEPDEHFVIGWAGSYTHYDDLKLIEQPIRRILRKNPNVRFRILGLLPDFLEGVDGVEFRTDVVDIADWQKKLKELNFNVGLVPLVDRPFNRGKSNIKWQEYSSAGVPTIASNVGEFKKLKVSETAILANTPKQWERAMQDAIDGNSHFSQVKLNSERLVTADYNIKTNIKDWDATYRRIIANFHS